MAWFSGKVSLGNFADLAGAVNKIQESVKNIEKNFDSALGFEEKPESSNDESSGLWPSTSDRKTLFNPVMALMGHKSEESTIESDIRESSQSPPTVEPPEKRESLQNLTAPEEKEGSKTDMSVHSASDKMVPDENKVPKAVKENEVSETAEGTKTMTSDPGKVEYESSSVPDETPKPGVQHVEALDSINNPQKIDSPEMGTAENTEPVQDKSGAIEVDQVHDITIVSDVSSKGFDSHGITDGPETRVVSTEGQQKHVESSDEQKTLMQSADEHKTQVENTDEQKKEEEDRLRKNSLVQADVSTNAPIEGGVEISHSHSRNTEENGNAQVLSVSHSHSTSVDEPSKMISRSVFQENDALFKAIEVDHQPSEGEVEHKEQHLSSGINAADSSHFEIELEKVRREMKMMDNALKGAARQAQAKADEITKLMNENEHFKSVIEDLKRKSNDAEIESMREEYHQRVATLERKVYTLTKERDTLRREQNRKSDATLLLKEKDEIISQVMAEGEELSKKQAAQESQIRKLRAQIRELEEEKKGYITKLQVEENKVESIKRDKAATEKLLQETIEKHQTELAGQKEYYTHALNAAKEAEALAEAHANDEARAELESRLREAGEREAMLVQSLEELRQTLSRTEHQAVFREDMLRRDIEDLQKRYQASERRCEELITQVPESTRPLLRQIEAMQETTARRAEAWAAVERSLNSRLQEEEAKAAAAEERERSVNERLSQTLSRVNVLEAQISCLRTEQMQLSRSLEKERQRAGEIRQEYLAAKEEADTQEDRVNQLEEEIKELRQKHKKELHDALIHREHLQQEIEREKTARLELEQTSRLQSTSVPDKTTIARQNSAFENGNLARKLSSASSLGSMEESYFLRASLDDSPDSVSDRRNFGEATMSPYYGKSMTPNAFGAALRQKEGELASYMSRLQSLESIRDSLAEELVKMTEQCEKLRAEAGTLPGIHAELDALRRRHSAALELMGERDEELEELRADIVDLKEMYREQVNLLVNKIQILSSSMSTA